MFSTMLFHLFTVGFAMTGTNLGAIHAHDAAHDKQQRGISLGAKGAMSKHPHKGHSLMRRGDQAAVPSKHEDNMNKEQESTHNELTQNAKASAGQNKDDASADAAEDVSSRAPVTHNQSYYLNVQGNKFFAPCDSGGLIAMNQGKATQHPPSGSKPRGWWTIVRQQGNGAVQNGDVVWLRSTANGGWLVSDGSGGDCSGDLKLSTSTSKPGDNSGKFEIQNLQDAQGQINVNMQVKIKSRGANGAYLNVCGGSVPGCGGPKIDTKGGNSPPFVIRGT